MSNYEKLLNSVNEIKTLAVHLKALGKITLKTEDENLKQAIAPVIQLLQTAYRRSKCKSMPVSLNTTRYNEINSMINYCQREVGSKKPEWQILAERNGWAPKK